YLNYSLENEQTDNGLLLHGSQGNLVSGVKTRLSDTSSVYVEERYQNGGSLSGLTHTTGVNLTTKEHLNFRGGAEFGKLSDAQTGAALARKAARLRMCYDASKMRRSRAGEYVRGRAAHR